MFTRSSSSDESEKPDALVNTKAAFRVSVCLQRYFSDVRSKCYLLVIRNRPVRWLERRIQKLFALPGDFCILTNGHMLPSSEPLALLNPEDSIEVVPLPETNGNYTFTRDNIKNKINDPFNSESYKQSENNNSTLLGNWKECIRNNFPNKLPQNVESNGKETLKGADEDQTDCVKKSNSPNADDERNSNSNVVNGICSESRDYFYGADDSTHSLSNLKRKALALLDSKICADAEGQGDEGSSDPPRKTRRRVRRRRRRTAEPGQLEYCPGSFPSDEQQTLPEDTPPSAAEAMAASTDYQTATETKLQDAAVLKMNDASWEPDRDMNVSLFQELTKNETISSRKPRVVRSLNA